ncbi:MAG TPA: LAGLIDADG family homing endonuclease, partial [Acidimicrobiia bacterium]
MAITPQQLGIGIGRRFTEAGTHPYDMVVWESRDARIPNFKDGGDAFFQPAVEFPVSWSLNATNIVAQKYFRGTLGTAERERSLREVIDRVADTIADWGERDGYFVDDEEATAFRDELKYLLVTQRAAFNSPVWFNIGVKDVPQQASACFILSVDDTMDSILNWYREEGIIFKGGSGAGVNLSRIRSSKEHLKGGGTASGPVSFMRGADASAGTIKSGGKTRRAAKMVILDVDHPDVEEFIWCKAREEHKARALREAGFDMDLDGIDSHSIQYQNANNSVRVSDDFMQAVVDDRDWHLRAATDGSVLKTVRARDLWREIAQASWECADPGLQFDTTINHWHTACTTGRINASNPCFTGDALVHTDKGLIRFDALVARAQRGESFGIYTHDATNPDAPAERVEITRPEAFMVTGFNEIVKLRFDNGMELRCTPNHRVWTENRGYVRADELTLDDDVKTLTLPTPAVHADWKLPVTAKLAALAARPRNDGRSGALELPEKWSDELAHYLGWLVGDGCISGNVVSTVYGSEDEVAEILPHHRALAQELNGGRPSKPSVQRNGTVQLRQSRLPIRRFFDELGVSAKKAHEKVVPESIYTAPPEVQAAFLRGLFDADGCVYDGSTVRYVGLGSASRELLIGVQRLLTSFGVFSRIYQTRKAGEGSQFTYTRADSSEVEYESRDAFDLRIANTSVAAFAQSIGFMLSRKAAKLDRYLAEHRLNTTKKTVRLAERSDDGVELTYNLCEPRNHSYIANGTIVANCSEYMHLDNSACNLASINLLHYLDEEGNFDVDGYKHTVEVMFTAQEILVGNADYPTPQIADTSRRFRQLGLGYANLGALLMALGLPYDSAPGRAWAAALTSLMTGHAYATSARTAARMGPFAGFDDNREHMLRVLQQHRDAAAKIDEDVVPAELVGAAQWSWDEACELGERYGVRNSQSTVLAPTGCLVGGTLVPTEYGLVRLGSLGDPLGEQWQSLDIDVASESAAQRATKFYVNGVEQVVDAVTKRGYRVRGTTKHRVKVVDEQGDWQWRRLADLQPGDRVPLRLGGMVGTPQVVALAPEGEGYRWAREHAFAAPTTMTAELAELVGYFMGDGSLHAKGLRFCVSGGDYDVVDHLTRAAKSLFGLEATTGAEKGYISVEVNSVRLAAWWEANGFAKRRPHEGHRGKGWTAHVPDAVLHTNDTDVYRAFLRGLYEADGTVTLGYPSWTTVSMELSHDVQTMLLALGFVTTRKFDTSGRGSRLAVLRLLNKAQNVRFREEIGFIGGRKNASIDTSELQQASRDDHIPVSRELLNRVVPVNDRDRKVAFTEFRRSGTITRRLAREIVGRTDDAELLGLLDYFYDEVATAELGGEEFTYDLSVPANV